MSDHPEETVDPNEAIIVDLIARAIHRANDDELGMEFDVDAADWYQREAVQVLEDLRAAGLDIVNEYVAVQNLPQPPVSLRRRSITRPLDPHRVWAPDPATPNTSGADKLYGGND